MGQFKESTMKSFAFVCLFAAADADAEADPALLYSSLGYGYAGYHHPYTYGAYAPYVAAVPAVHSAAVKSVVEPPAEVKTTVSRRPRRDLQRCPSRRRRLPRRLQHRRSRRLPRRVQHRRRSRGSEGRLLRQLWRRCPHCQEGG